VFVLIDLDPELEVDLWKTECGGTVSLLVGFVRIADLEQKRVFLFFLADIKATEIKLLPIFLQNEG